MIPRTEWPIRLVGTSLELTANHIAAAAASKSFQSCPTLCDPIDRQPTKLPCPCDSPGKNTGVGCHFLLLCLT